VYGKWKTSSKGHVARTEINNFLFSLNGSQVT